MSARIVSRNDQKTIPAHSMQPGEIGTMQYGGDTLIVLKTFDCVVDLNNPARNWESPSLHVTLLPPGSVVELTAK